MGVLDDLLVGRGPATGADLAGVPIPAPLNAGPQFGAPPELAPAPPSLGKNVRPGPPRASGLLDRIEAQGGAPLGAQPPPRDPFAELPVAPTFTPEVPGRVQFGEKVRSLYEGVTNIPAHIRAVGSAAMAGLGGAPANIERYFSGETPTNPGQESFNASMADIDASRGVPLPERYLARQMGPPVPPGFSPPEPTATPGLAPVPTTPEAAGLAGQLQAEGQAALTPPNMDEALKRLGITPSRKGNVGRTASDGLYDGTTATLRPGGLFRTGLDQSFTAQTEANNRAAGTLQPGVQDLTGQYGNQAVFARRRQLADGTSQAEFSDINALGQRVIPDRSTGDPVYDRAAQISMAQLNVDPNYPISSAKQKEVADRALEIVKNEQSFAKAGKSPTPPKVAVVTSQDSDVRPGQVANRNNGVLANLATQPEWRGAAWHQMVDDEFAGMAEGMIESGLFPRFFPGSDTDTVQENLKTIKKSGAPLTGMFRQLGLTPLDALGQKWAMGGQGTGVERRPVSDSEFNPSIAMRSLMMNAYEKYRTTGKAE